MTKYSKHLREGAFKLYASGMPILQVCKELGISNTIFYKWAKDNNWVLRRKRIERIAVLIGEKGSTKRSLQKKANCKITVSSKEGDVLIDSEDNFNVFIAVKIVKAIARGFNPRVALKLLDENSSFELVNISDFSGKSKKKEERIKSRVIGTNGKARRSLERMTDCYISVYGKTIGIIGKLEDVYLCKKALDKLLKGSPHSNVYKWIEIQRAREEKI